MPLVRITIVSGRNLQRKEFVFRFKLKHFSRTGICDPYVSVKLNRLQEVYRTRAVPKTMDPVWSETIRLNLSNPFTDNLLFEVFDRNHVSRYKHTSLGSWYVSLYFSKRIMFILERSYLTFFDVPFQKPTEKIIQLSHGGNIQVLIFAEDFGARKRPQKFQSIEQKKVQEQGQAPSKNEIYKARIPQYMFDHRQIQLNGYKLQHNFK